MKPKEQRYQELYEQVKLLIEVSETETRLSKLFPQSQFQIGNRDARGIASLKKKNTGKKGKYHSVIKMKTSSVVTKKDLSAEPEEQPVESPLNDGTMSPEETIRGMQDPLMVIKDLLSKGMNEEEILQQLIKQGMSEEEAVAAIQQVSTPQ